MCIYTYIHVHAYTYTYTYICIQNTYPCTSTEVLGLTCKSSIKYFTISTSPFCTAICTGCLPSYTHYSKYTICHWEEMFHLHLKNPHSTVLITSTYVRTHKLMEWCNTNCCSPSSNTIDYTHACMYLPIKLW